jgi:tetratricopeptide (TPR) repeat protein
MKSLLSAVLVVILVTVLSSHSAAQDGDRPVNQNSADAIHKAFSDGNALMKERKYCDALARFTEGLTLAPDVESLLYNGGLAAFQCKRYSKAIELWGSLRTLDPGDWQVRVKLIQSYQALGQLRERDAERASLFELRKQDSSGELSKQHQYCREQFEAGGEMVMAFEEFELTGERAVRYVFSILNASGRGEKCRISLGSYETTNSIWRETTEPRPEDTERLFHLDGYYEWGHATYGFYSPEPSYDEVRRAVIEILEKKRSPVSTSTTK